MEWCGVERIKLGLLPTRMYRLERLSEALGGPEIWIKRDDLTGLGFGGNKIRKLEFLMADALAKGCDTVLTVGGAQSNHACQTAAAARRLGLKAVLVLAKYRSTPPYPTGNLLLEKIMDADIRFVDVGSAAGLEEKMHRLASRLAEEGKKPYAIPLGGSNGIGAAGYALAAGEIVSQGGDFDHIFTACGTGGTVAGLVAGKRIYGASFKTVGINVGAMRRGLGERVSGLITETLATLGDDASAPEDFEILDGYTGKGYGIPTEEGIDAIRLLAQTEGLFLDPVYTSKAMAGLIDRVKKGKFDSSSRILFLHTGGAAALFAYGRYF